MERCATHSSLFRPLDAVAVRAPARVGGSPLSLAALTGVSTAPPRGICVHLKVWYTESMKKQSIESIYELLPEGWEEAAKSQKALVRGRNIKTAKELLKLVFLYQTSGESYGLTSAITQISGDQPALNKTAVQKRIVNSRAWLQWMCEHLCLQEGFLTAPPQWLAGYRVCVADASDYARQGSSYADFRLHYMMELFSLNLTEVYFTTAAEGETLTRYTHIREKDLILADRAYATRSGIFHVLDSHADFLLRMRSTSFSLYTATGERYDLTEMLKEHQPGKLIDLVLYIKREQQFVPVRICALGKTEEDVRKSQRQIKKTNHGRKPASDLQKIWSHYVVVVTSLPLSISAQRVLELYRMRWQIELVFKRFKSIFSGGAFTARREEAVKAWFYGKLLIAILCETLVKKGRFSPDEENSGQ